jgi:hypothetical protein
MGNRSQMAAYIFFVIGLLLVAVTVTILFMKKSASNQDTNKQQHLDNPRSAKLGQSTEDKTIKNFAKAPGTKGQNKATQNDSISDNETEANDGEHGWLEWIGSALSRPSITDWLIVGTYFVLAIIGLYQISLTRESAHTARSAADSAEKAFQQNESMSEQTLDNSKKQLRAYLFISGVHLERAGADWKFTLDIKNAGMTPASDIFLEFKNGFYTEQQAASQFSFFDRLQLTNRATPDFIAPGSNEKYLTLVQFQSEEVSEEGAKKHRYRQEELAFVGIISYRDVFGETWKLEWRYQYSGDDFSNGLKANVERVNVISK